MIAVFRWFGNSGAMQLEAPEDHVRVPGLTLEDARALVRLGIKRRACRRPLGDRGPEAPSPAPAVAAPAAPAFPLVEPAARQPRPRRERWWDRRPPRFLRRPLRPFRDRDRSPWDP